MQNKIRLHHIESIRAFAALSVALFHFTHAYHDDQFMLQSEGIRHFFQFGAQGVEIFYVISGFIIPYSLYHSRYKIKHYFIYLAKRFSRLIPPYFVTIGLITLVGYLLARFLWYSPYNVEWRNLFANAVFGVDFIQSSTTLIPYFPDNHWINPIFETLKVEVQFYLLIGLLFPLFLKKEVLLLVFAAATIALGIYTIPANTVLVFSPYFFIGIAAFYVREKGWNWINITLIGFCLAALFFFYVTQDFFAAIVGFSLIVWLPSQFKFLRYTGKISYSYYLIHGLSGGQFLYFMRNSEIYHSSPWLMVIFALLISWIAAFLIYFCIEKPSIILSNRIKYKDELDD